MVEIIGDKSDERDRRHHVTFRAWWRAMSGSYADTSEVVAMFVDEGFPEAKRWLNEPEMRGKMDEVCARARELDAAAATAQARPAPRSDEEAIVGVLDGEFTAAWNREYERWASHWVQKPYARWRAWVRGGGVAMRNSWDELALHMRQDIEQDPDRNPYFAYQHLRANWNLRVMGDMAWVTFDSVFPTADLPGFHGPATGHQTVVLERHEGRWKIAYLALIDEQFGQTETPIWEVDPAGRVVTQNLAAERFLRTESELGVRGGRVHMRDRDTDRRLLALIAEMAAYSTGTMNMKKAGPIVYDPGNDEPARVWWVTIEGGKVFVQFNDPQLAEEQAIRAARAHGLSPQQERLAVRLVQGLPLGEAASESGMRVSSARTQLQRMFDKLGVRTQPTLIRALLTVAEPG